jgi:hypothetical protein
MTVPANIYRANGRFFTDVFFSLDIRKVLRDSFPFHGLRALSARHWRRAFASHSIRLRDARHYAGN